MRSPDQPDQQSTCNLRETLPQRVCCSWRLHRAGNLTFSLKARKLVICSAEALQLTRSGGATSAAGDTGIWGKLHLVVDRQQLLLALAQGCRLTLCLEACQLGVHAIHRSQQIRLAELDLHDALWLEHASPGSGVSVHLHLHVKLHVSKYQQASRTGWRRTWSPRYPLARAHWPWLWVSVHLHLDVELHVSRSLQASRSGSQHLVSGAVLPAAKGTQQLRPQSQQHLGSVDLAVDDNPCAATQLCAGRQVHDDWVAVRA